MNRRSFLWRSLCSSVPLLTRSSFPQQTASPPPAKLADADVTLFARALAGNIIRPGDPKYDQLRKGYAAKIDAHPALIVHPVNPRDVQTTVIFANSNHLPLAVRCGGHSYAGYSTCEGGIVLDMSGLRSIEIASDKSHAKIGGGMLCGAVEIATAPAGRAAVLGQCPSVGVGGFLLGGGVGPLMSMYGLGCDNILAADLVLADGSLVKASPHENPDLYWAIRGGGGNFGVVTAFELALHPVSNVFAGDIALQSADPREILKAFRDFLPEIPDELTVIAAINAQPAHKPRLDIQACFLGDPAVGEKLLAPLRHHPAVIHDTIQSRPYLELEQMVPADIPPSYHEHAGGFISELTDQRIEVLATAFTNPPCRVDCFLVHLHGAVTRVPQAATAFPLRRNGLSCDVSAYWTPATGNSAARQWVDSMNANLPVEDDGTYVNGMDRVGETRVRRAYGNNYARLQHVKAHYDPHNLFSLNQNIRPA